MPTSEITRRDLLAALAVLGVAGCTGAQPLAPAPQQRGGADASSLEMREMKVGHIYADADGGTHIGELDVALTENAGRALFFNSTRFAASAVGFQYVRAGGATDWHKPPQRWLAFILSGTWEIETSDGTRRQFPAGSVSLVDDTTGKGHRGRAVGDADVLVASVTLGADVVIA